ncbi:MAG: hypothetical protein RL156_1593 [Bacteroidota bacterium]
MHSSLQPTHVIIDSDALQSFSDRNMFTQTALPALCQKLGFRLHVLIGQDPGYLVHDYPASSQSPRTALLKNESCSCERSACIRDAVLSSIETDAYVIAIISAQSSICLATYADRIFANGSARNACEEKQYPHHPVNQWNDVEKVLRTFVSADRFSPRRQARLQRMDVIKSE